MTNESNRAAGDLLPCPFCGGEPVLKQYRADGLEIKCSSCHSGRQQRWMHKGRDWLEAKMIERWNERAAPAEDVRAMVDEPVAIVADMGFGKKYVRSLTELDDLPPIGTKLYARKTDG